jgi:hypothetical protein
MAAAGATWHSTKTGRKFVQLSGESRQAAARRR